MLNKEKQARMVAKFVEVYCHHHHGTQQTSICDQCTDLLDYAQERLASCPFDPKPKCKDCRVHCYEEPYRSRIRELMKFSGMHLIKRGLPDWLMRQFKAK